jgi:hypothetical protein
VCAPPERARSRERAPELMNSQDHYQETPRLPPEELCVAKSFSLRPNLITAIRVRASCLGVSMSAYISTVVRNDLAKGMNAPLSIQPEGAPLRESQSPRGVVVEFDPED